MRTHISHNSSDNMIQRIWRIFAAINFPHLKHKSCEPMCLCFRVHLEELRYIRASAIPVISPCFPDSAAIQSVLPSLFLSLASRTSWAVFGTANLDLLGGAGVRRLCRGASGVGLEWTSGRVSTLGPGR